MCDFIFVVDNEKNYSERGCCENVESVSLESCASPESPASGGSYAKWALVAAAISASAALLAC